jgi:hypothetical protein
MATVVHVKDKVPNAVYIGRGSEWGNPYRIGPDGTREDVIAKYRVHLWNRLKHDLTGYELMCRLADLHGKQLACYCSPQPCHGDVLVRAAAWANDSIHPFAD